jgi:hypothetical protein
MNFFVTFERNSNGFAMRTRMALPTGSGGSPVDELLARPIVFQISSDGTIVSVANEQAYWDLIDQGMNRFLPIQMKDDPKGQAMVRKIFDDMRKLPTEQRLALLAKNFQPILDMAGVELSIGETIEADDEGVLPLPSLGNITLQRQIRLTLQSADQSTATLTYVTSYDPEAMKATIEKMMELVPPEKRKPVTPMNVRHDATYVVSLKTGLTETYEEVIQLGESPDDKRVTKLVRLPN